MQVLIELTDEGMDDIVVEGLKRGFEVNLNFKDEEHFEEVDHAFRVLLDYYMLEKEFKKYIKPFDNPKGKRLTEAYGGL